MYMIISDTDSDSVTPYKLFGVKVDSRMFCIEDTEQQWLTIYVHVNVTLTMSEVTTQAGIIMSHSHARNQ